VKIYGYVDTYKPEEALSMVEISNERVIRYRLYAPINKN